MKECKNIEEKKEARDNANFEPIIIELKDIKYILNIETNKENIIFYIYDKNQFPSIKYIKTMTFKEIKELNKVFYVLNSFNDFYDYLKQLSNNNKLNINKTNDRITLIFYVEVLLKQQKIEIDLYPSKRDINLSIEEIFQELFNIKNKNKDIEALKNENNNLKNKMQEIINEMNIIKNENKKLNNEIITLKIFNNNMHNQMQLKFKEQNEEINNLNENLLKCMIKSAIMKYDEKDMIIKGIENKMDKRIKEIKKLYQATIDGGDPKCFHSKCDDIPNTLVVIQSEGNRRFGGFTPKSWKSKRGKGIYSIDFEKQTFVFSLNNKKIYYLKNIFDAVFHCKDYGPCFGFGHDIGIEGNPIKENKLYTTKSTFNYEEDKDNLGLSEYEYPNKLKALEYEVFQIIFY